MIPNRETDDTLEDPAALIEWARKNGELELDLSQGGLTELPESIGQLTALQTLNASGNKLSELPPSIGLLTALESLDVSNNKLAEVPQSIADLPGLEWLDL